MYNVRRCDMIKNKRGLSTVVTTLIIILLVLVAIGIIWVVVKNVLDSGSNEIDLRTKCLSVDVQATAVACDPRYIPNNCSVTLERTRGSDEIAGVKLVFHNSTNDLSSTVVQEYGQNIGLLATTKTAYLNTTVLGNGTDSVDVVPYFRTATGDDYICATKTTYGY